MELIDDRTIVLVWRGDSMVGSPDQRLLQIAEAFGFPDTDTYLDALEREGPRIFRRMRWSAPAKPQTKRGNER